MDAMNWNSPEFLREYVAAIRNGSAAVFVGAGMSRAAGYVDWRGLLRKAATDIGLDVEREPDLVAIAQYYKDHSGTRGPINQLLIDAFPDTANPTENHKLLAALPIRTLWTTNYDRLIEGGYKAVGKRLQTVITKANMATTAQDRDAVLLKLHGDIEQPDQTVLTKDDYELFHQRPDAQLFTESLKGDLVEKTFLFVGFSFEDPNLDYILGRIRVLMGESKRRHFWVVKAIDPSTGATPEQKTELQYAQRKQQLRIKDLKRYGITAVLIHDYADVTRLLQRLAHLTRLTRVFVSGAVHDPDPLGLARVQELAELIGQAAVEQAGVVVSGFGKDIGPHMVYGAVQAAHAKKKDYAKCVDIRPFPYMAPVAERPALYRRHRQEMISTCGVAIFLSGNKQSDKGDTIPSPGIQEEFELCVANGVYVIPLGCSGHVAHTVWTQVSKEPERFYPGFDLRPQLAVIGDHTKTNAEIIVAVKKMLEVLTTI
jgi:hypothetical protein